jgi:hypothetical protein
LFGKTFNFKLCADSDQVQGFFSLILDSIDDALAAPDTSAFELEAEVRQTLFDVFDFKRPLHRSRCRWLDSSTV